MYCKNLLKRQRKYKPYFYCKALRKEIILPCNENCSKLILATNKPIKKVSNKRNKLEKNRFSIFTNNFNQCYYCKRKVKENEKLDLHEVYGGSNRLRSIRMGFVVPLCRKCHSNEKVINYLRILIQKEFEKTRTREEFIKITGKSYIKGDDQKMKEYKDKKITEINRVEVGIKCDNCKKIIKNEDDYKRTCLQHKHYYQVTTHHHDWGNDSIESYEYYDFCNEDCLFMFLKKYYDGEEATLCCEIEEIRI